MRLLLDASFKKKQNQTLLFHVTFITIYSSIIYSSNQKLLFSTGSFPSTVIKEEEESLKKRKERKRLEAKIFIHR